jgi:hypothetical protein
VEAGVERTFVGGLRWGRFNATWPLANLTVGPDGIKIRPSRRLLGGLGVPTLDFRWAVIDRVEAVRGVLPFSFGIEIDNPRKRLIWWSLSAEASEEILAAIATGAPEKLAETAKRRVVF